MTGRPTKFKPEYVGQAEKLCLLGATDGEIADFFEVSVATINRWKTAHEDFCESLKAGKAAADDRVERSLYQRALGYTHDEDKIFNNNGEPLVVPTKKHYPPDTTAAIFWLKNRRGDEWRDKRELEVTDTRSEEEIDAAIRERLAKLAADGEDRILN